MSKRDRRPVVVYPNDFVLGSPSRVIPAGTILRTPDAPRCLDFDGYNVLSLKMAIAGLSGGDVLKIYVAASDPESSTAEPLANNISQVLAITANADGNYGATVSLVEVLGGSGGGGTQTAVPYDAGTNSIAWGHPGQASFVDGWNDPAGFNSFTPGLGFGGVLTSLIHLQGLTDPGVRTGFQIGLAMRSDLNSTTMRMNIVSIRPGHILASYFYGNPGYAGALPPVDGGLVTGAFADYVMPIDPIDAAFIDFTEDLTVNIEYGGPVFSGVPPLKTWDFKGLTFQCPGGGGTGITEVSIPFYRNLLIFDASACAHDITVDEMFTTLTNAHRSARNRL